MNCELLNKEGNEAVIKLHLDKSEFKAAINQAYKKDRKKFNIQGFRKGKAPRQIIEQRYGKGVFFEEAINILLPKYYPEAIETLELDPVSRPDIDLKDVSLDEGVVIEAKFFVKPEVELGDYKGVEVEKVDAEVTDEMIDAEIKKVQEQNARIVTVEDRAIEDGDITTIDFVGTLDGEEFEGGKAENFELTIGSGQFIPGFEEQLIGANVDDEVKVEVTFPEDYQADDLAGKDVVFMVTVQGVKSKELPELNDDFAKDTSEFDTFEEYKNNLKEELTKSAKESADRAQRDKVIEAVCDNATIDIPEVMVENEIDGMIREMQQQLQYQGLSFDQFLQFQGKTIEDYREDVKESAETRVKTSLTIEKIKEVEAIEVTDEDVEKELERLAEVQNTSVDQVREMFKVNNYEYLKASLSSKKSVDLIVDSAKLV